VRHTVFSSPLYHRGHLRSGQNISGTVKPGFPSEYFFSPKFSLCLDISRDVSTLLGHSRCFSMVLGRSRSRLGASFATLPPGVLMSPQLAERGATGLIRRPRYHNQVRAIPASISGGPLLTMTVYRLQHPAGPAPVSREDGDQKDASCWLAESFVL
jgi:hypothetical protein